VAIGLINAAVPRPDLERETIDLARRLMAKNPEVLRGTKQALRMVRDMDHARANEYLRIKMAEVPLRDRERARDAFEPAKRHYFAGESPRG
jgi:trans-feruloyl-CoA hydratase/vanillin synthase